MKKIFFILMALLVSASFAFAADISNPDLLAQGFDESHNDGTFDATSQILTFNGAWTGMSWTFWDSADQLADDYQSLTVEFEAVDFWVEVAIADYRDGGVGWITTVGADPGATSITVPINCPVSYVTFQGGDGATSIKILAAYLTPKGTAVSDMDLLAKGFGAFYPSDDNGVPTEGAPTYDEDTQTITFSQNESNIGWNFWGNENQLANYKTCVVEFEPAECSMILVIANWNSDAGATGEIDRVVIPAGATTATINVVPASTIVLQAEDADWTFPATLKLKSAKLTAGGEEPACPVIQDFSGLPDGNVGSATQPGWLVNGIMDNIAVAKYLVIETSGVGDNAAAFGGVHFIYQGNNDDNSVKIDWQDVNLTADWQSYTRADGKIVSIAINLENAIKSTSPDNYDYFLQCTGWARILLAYYPDGGLTAFQGLGFTNAYLTTDFAKPDGAVDLKGGAELGFIFDGSIACTPTSEKIVLSPVVVLPAYGVTNGIVVNAVNEKVSIYGIDGRLVKQVVANNQTIDMARGLYIVKVGAEKAVKVVVK